MREIDLNSLRDQARSVNQEELNNLKSMGYEEYAAMPPDELAKIADKNGTTPEKFLQSIKFTDSLRKTVTKNSGTPVDDAPSSKDIE